MKKTNTTIDKSAPYRTMSIGKVEAPVKPKGEPGAGKITSKTDLRDKRG